MAALSRQTGAPKPLSVRHRRLDGFGRLLVLMVQSLTVIMLDVVIHDDVVVTCHLVTVDR